MPSFLPMGLPLYWAPTGVGPEPQKAAVLELEELESGIPKSFYEQGSCPTLMIGVPHFDPE